MRAAEFDKELLKAVPKIRNYCRWIGLNYGLNTDDLVQEALTTALECSGRYESYTNMSAWVIQIAVNQASQLIRRRSISPIENWDQEFDDPDSYTCIQPHAHDIAVIQRSVTMLRGKQLRLLRLKMKGYRNAEIAKLTNTSIAGVKNHLNLARRAVEKRLNNIYFTNNLILKPEPMNTLPAVKSNTSVAAAQQAPIQQSAPLPDKIAISLTSDEWRMLTTHVLGESENAWKIQDKYMKALLYPLLRAVYIKLHNKLHSLKLSKNTLNLTLPEASVLASALLELNSDNYLIVSITGYIDQKLT